MFVIIIFCSTISFMMGLAIGHMIPRQVEYSTVDIEPPKCPICTEFPSSGKGMGDFQQYSCGRCKVSWQEPRLRVVDAG